MGDQAIPQAVCDAVNDVKDQTERMVIYDHIDTQAARIAELEAALMRIEDTDPDEGTPWFHEVARTALAGGKNEMDN